MRCAWACAGAVSRLALLVFGNQSLHYSPSLDSCLARQQLISFLMVLLALSPMALHPCLIPLKDAGPSSVERIVRPWKAGGLPRTDRLRQRPRQPTSVTAAAECSSARASSAVLVLSPPLSCPGASAFAKAPVRSTCRRCRHGQTIRQPTSRSTVHSAIPYYARV